MRTLILACSATKAQKQRRLIRAWHRYDGPAWRTLRANTYGAEIHGPHASLQVFALSAEHGLISADAQIEDYDRRMDPARARELIDPTAAKLFELARAGELEGEIFACGGGAYRHVLEDARAIAGHRLGREIPIAFSSGGIGEQLGQLKAWLRRDA